MIGLGMVLPYFILIHFLVVVFEGINLKGDAVYILMWNA
jgi:hypothetical protein